MHARTQIHTQPCAQLRAHATTHAHSHARAHVHTHAQSLTHTLIVAIYRIRFPALSAIRCQPRAHAATRARVRHTRTQTRIHARTHARTVTHSLSQQIEDTYQPEISHWGTWSLFPDRNCWRNRSSDSHANSIQQQSCTRTWTQTSGLVYSPWKYCRSMKWTGLQYKKPMYLRLA